MPVYDYFCKTCEKNYDVSCSIGAYTGKDPCPECKEVGQRIVRPRINFTGEKVECAEFNPAFGQVVKNKYHRAELARQYGVEEIGNESPTVHEKMDEERIKRIERSWDEV